MPMTVTNFAEKLSYLLLQLGVTQKWLTDKLYITPANISQWKHNNTIPNTRVSPLCKYLYITRDTLQLDIEPFKQAIQVRLTTHTGVRWNTFMDRYAKKGLVLTKRKTATPDGFKALYPTPQATSIRTMKLDCVTVGQAIQFTLPVEQVLLSDYQEIKGYAYFVKDNEAIHCAEYGGALKPSSVSPHAYVIPSRLEEPWFYAGEPLGHHHCYLLLLSKPIPVTIQEYLAIQQISTATEEMALWLMAKKADFIIKEYEFFVTPQ